jgi:hypothetical protein
MTASENNGAASLPPHDVTELILSNGLRAWVHPVTQRDNRELILGWQKDNPMPDKKEYERPVDPEFASFEGQTVPAEENPEWQNLMLERHNALNNHVTSAYLLGFMEFPDFTDDQLIEHFAGTVARKRRVMDVPDDPWQATILFGVLQTADDQRNVVWAVERKLPVEAGEVAEAVRIFRPHTVGRANGQVPDGRTETQSPATEAEPQPGDEQPAV